MKLTDVQAATLAATYIRKGRLADALEVLEVWFGGTLETLPDEQRQEIEEMTAA